MGLWSGLSLTVAAEEAPDNLGLRPPFRLRLTLLSRLNTIAAGVDSRLYLRISYLQTSELRLCVRSPRGGWVPPGFRLSPRPWRPWREADTVVPSREPSYIGH